jgi:D-alanine-D-alanine ligase
MDQIPAPLTGHRIVVLAGGCSAEREISLQSGEAVLSALASSGCEILLIDPAIVDLYQMRWQPHDMAFIALHGQFGEDGEVQELLERAGVPYTGSDASTSRTAFSKSAAKLRFLQNGIPTPPFVLIHRSDSAARLRDVAARIGYPLVVKPDQQGSSLGVSLVADESELDDATEHCFDYGAFGIIERAIAGTEWTQPVLDAQPLPLIHIATPREFFDFDAKYHDDETQYLFEFSQPAAVVQQIASAGTGACAALGTSGLARADLRVDESGKPWVLEVNTVPGLTEHSLVPKAAAQLGLSFTALCEAALQSALMQHARRGMHPAAGQRQAG